MKNTIMDRSAEKQAQIDLRRTEVTASYAELWARVITEWNNPGPEDRAWLIYSANYLFRTGNVRWAIDPITLRQRVPQAPWMDVAYDLQALSFVLLTHRHADHLDLEMLRSLRDLPIRWVVPQPLLSLLVKQAGLSEASITVPKPMQPVKFKEITVVPFEGLHGKRLLKSSAGIPSGVLRGVPAMAYLVAFHGKRWLFPGDTRTYNASLLPAFGRVDGLFAHLWLGSGQALAGEMRLLEAFCRFCLDLQPDRIVVTHMEELGRRAEDYWDKTHFQQVKSCLRRYSPHTPVITATMGEAIVL